MTVLAVVTVVTVGTVVTKVTEETKFFCPNFFYSSFLSTFFALKNVTKLKKLIVLIVTKSSKFQIGTKVETQIVTKLRNSNCDTTQKFIL